MLDGLAGYPGHIGRGSQAGYQVLLALKTLQHNGLQGVQRAGDHLQASIVADAVQLPIQLLATAVHICWL